MKNIKKSSFRRNWDDEYYDGFVVNGEGFDEDTQQVLGSIDFWSEGIKDSNGYIEFESDEWILDTMKTYE